MTRFFSAPPPDYSGMYQSPRSTSIRPDEAAESDADGKRKRISLNDYKQRKSEPHESIDPRFNPSYGYPYSQYPADSNRPAGLVAKDYSYERVGRRQITSREGGMGLPGKLAAARSG